MSRGKTQMVTAKVGAFAGGLLMAGALMVGGAGCSDDAGSSSEGEVTARVSSRLTAGTIKAINGTYTNCVAKTGSWSIRVSGADPLTNPVLGVVVNDTNCQLAITEIVADQVYSGSPSLALTDSYAGSASTFTYSSTSFKANAKLSAATFASNFDITLVHSDDPTTMDGGAATGQYATVQTSTVNEIIPASDYTFSLTVGTPLAIQMDANKTVLSVSGNATLSYGSNQGAQYIIDRGTLGASATMSDIATAWATESLAGRVQTLTNNQNATIPASAFALTSLSSNVIRTVVVARTVGAVTAYQVFRVTFKGS